MITVRIAISGDDGERPKWRCALLEILANNLHLRLHASTYGNIARREAS